MIKYKNDIYKKIKIRAFEENKGMKQLVTEKFFSAGTLTKIKNNDINISIMTLDALCDFLNCDISEIKPISGLRFILHPKQKTIFL